MLKINQPDIPLIYKELADLRELVARLLIEPDGHIIEDGSGVYPQRSKLRFIGIGQRVSDNAIDDATEIDITSPSIVGQIVMDEDGPEFSIVTVDGKIADSNNIAAVGRVAGVSMAAFLTGFPSDIVFHGLIDNPLWNWNEGDVLFLNGTSLSTTQPSSGFSQIIGTAKSPTKVLINLEEPILL